MNDKVSALAHAAGSAAAAGRWQEAERLWHQVRALDENHVQALFSLGVHAYQRGDLGGASEFLEGACQRAPREPAILLTLARVHRDRGLPQAEWGAITAALAIDPYFLPGLLAKAEHLEGQRKARAAAAVFRDVLKVAPPEAEWPPALQTKLAHARDAVRRDMDELVGFLQHRLGHQFAGLDGESASRWDEAVSVLAGKSRPYRSECNHLHVPRLPAITFYDDALFPWMRELEACTDAIKSELLDMLARRDAGFVPYIQYKPGDPVNQWGKLNHSRNWSGFHLYAHGQPIEEHLAECPRTASALAMVDTVAIAGLCPNAMFSALAPGAHIPPHTGETNARLVAHLPLMVPEGCSYRVGYDWRRWREGKCWVFDDTIEHEARNDGTQVRVILMFDVWNPLLSIAEREIVSALSAAHFEYRGATDA